MKTLTAICMLVLLVSQVYAYTYDGNFDPKNLFSYQPVLVEQLTPITALMVVKANEKVVPQYAIVCALRVTDGVVILAYAYFNDKGEFKHFILKDGHYQDTPLDCTQESQAKLEKRLKKLLNHFRKVTDI